MLKNNSLLIFIILILTILYFHAAQADVTLSPYGVAVALEADAEETVEMTHTDDSRSIQQSLRETSGQIENLLIEAEERQTKPLLPSGFELTTVYPNPFNSSIKLGFSLPEDAEIKLTIFDLLGREVAVLFEGAKEAGKYSAIWNSKGIAAGSYMLSLESAGEVRTQKLTLIK